MLLKKDIKDSLTRQGMQNIMASTKNGKKGEAKVRARKQSLLTFVSTCLWRSKIGYNKGFATTGGWQPGRKVRLQDYKIRVNRQPGR